MTEATTTGEHATYDGDQFWETFAPAESPSGSAGTHLWTPDEVTDQPVAHVWTIVEADDGSLQALPGFRTANRFGYVVTTTGWPHEDVSGLWWREPLDNCLTTDQPTDCPKCQRRSLFTDLHDGRELHCCPGCGYRFLALSPEWTGEEQCEYCRQFTLLGHLNGSGVCDRCLRQGVVFCTNCDDVAGPDDHEHDED
ncbi:MAG: hypothetical protein L0H93_07580 [Nocardioides sp.]|nr:hypothetical protein [Nocardioides sp.]